MKFIYKGKFKDYDDLPKAELPENAVCFEEPDTIEDVTNIAMKYGLIMVAVFIAIMAIKCFIAVSNNIFYLGIKGLIAGYILFFPSLLIHEFLHGICFNKNAEVEIYNALSKGILFVTSTEPMTKNRFIFMSLCPNIVFGLIPTLLAVFLPATGEMFWFFAAFAMRCRGRSDECVKLYQAGAGRCDGGFKRNTFLLVFGGDRWERKINI